MSFNDSDGGIRRYGRVVLKLGDDVSTDMIFPGRFMATVLPDETPRYAFADMEAFSSRLQGGQIPRGSIVVGGANFGCGSSREQAVSCLKGHGLVIVARGFARIFLQNSINLGLNVFICPALEAEEGDELTISEDWVLNNSSGMIFRLESMPAARRKIMEAGGLIPYTRERLRRMHDGGSHPHRE